LVEARGDTGDADEERKEPDVAVYSDALLLIDALERHDVTALENVETPGLVNLYTLLSDVQRNANDLRQDVRSVLLDRLHHDQPVSGQFGSVQRTSRRNRSLKDDETVLSLLEDAGIERERVTTVDDSKVDDALEVTQLSESDVYDVEQSEYVRKADVDEDEKETRLQGLKDRLAETEGEEADELREEIEALEERIATLTEFRSGRSFHESASGG
jgi:vacuolar-type H+-ATPase subunit I/STV1